MKTLNALAFCLLFSFTTTIHAHEEDDLVIEEPDVDLLVSPAKESQAQDDVFEAPFYYNARFRNFYNRDRARVIKALEAIVEVVQTEEFKQAVLEFKDKRGRKAFLENNGLSNQQIYERLMSGAERLRPKPDQTMDLDITWYYRNNNTVGYTYRSSQRIWVNSKFYRRYSTAQMARNLFHEWTHKMGFGHRYRSNRPYTVPYGLGKKMEQLVKQRLVTNRTSLEDNDG